MKYVLSMSYSFDIVENNLVAINSEMEKVIILGDIEQFLLSNITKMSEEQVVELACKEYSGSDCIASDIHDFIESLLAEGLIEIENNDVESTQY